jgi:hypothetical protein
MKICTIIAAVSLCTCLATAVAADQPNGAKTGQFDEILTITVQGATDATPRLTERTVATTQFKGLSVRIDTVDNKYYRPIEMVSDGQFQYVYDPSAHSAIRKALTIAPDSVPAQLKKKADSLVAGATKSGSETVDGYPCDVYTTTVENGTVQVKMWLSKDPHFPYVVLSPQLNLKTFDWIRVFQTPLLHFRTRRG